MPRARHLRALWAVALAMALAVAVAACGDSASSGAGASPANVVPSSAPMYVEGVVRPEGGQKDDVLDAARKLLGTDNPEDQLKQLFDQVLGESGTGFDYERDIAPWLGERAGLFVENFGADGGDFNGAAVLAAKDPDKARDAIAKAASTASTPVRDASHNGVDYKVDEDAFAAAVVGDFVVFGDEASLKKVIDAEKGAANLADSDRFKTVASSLDEDRIGTFFVDAKSVFDLAKAADPVAGAQLEQFESLLNTDQLPPFGGGLTADGDAISLDVAAQNVKGGLGSLGPLSKQGSSDLIGDVPGDSWVAFAAPDVGKTGQQLLKQLSALGAGALAGQLESKTGLDVEQDILSWVGDVAIFVRGTSLADIGGGALVEVTDEGKASAAVDKLIGVAARETGLPPTRASIPGASKAYSLGSPAPGVPTMFIALAGDRLVIALGEKSARDALGGGDKLEGSARFEAAEEALDGMDPMLIVGVPEALQLAQTAGAGQDPSFQMAKTYLDRLSVVAIGSKVDGDTTRGRISVGLK